MPKQKAWDEVRELRLAGMSPQPISVFLRTELPKARRLVDELQKKRSTIDVASYRLQLIDEIRKQSGK